MIQKSLALLVCSVVLIGCSSETPVMKTAPGPLATPPAVAGDYEIRIDVPFTVGDQRELQVVGTKIKSTLTKYPGKQDKSKVQKSEFLFTGRVKTLAVNERGIETKAE